MVRKGKEDEAVKLLIGIKEMEGNETYDENSKTTKLL